MRCKTEPLLRTLEYIFFSTLYSTVIALNLSMGAEKNREETVDIELTTLTYN